MCCDTPFSGTFLKNVTTFLLEIFYVGKISIVTIVNRVKSFKNIKRLKLAETKKSLNSRGGEVEKMGYQIITLT